MSSRSCSTTDDGCESSPIANPLVPSYASRHQPSRMLRFNPPLQMIFCPLVPEASSGRLGCVQPDIAPGDHLARDMDVIVFDKDQAASQLAVLAEVNDFLDLAFALVIRRMRLAGKDELDRPERIGRKFHDGIIIFKHERSAFVGGETPSQNRW